MKRLLITLLTLTLLTSLVSADAIDTVKGFNYFDKSGIVLGDNVPFYLGTGSNSAGVKTADLKILPDGTNIGITGAGNLDMSSYTGDLVLPASLTISTDVTGTSNTGLITSMQLIENASVVDVDYVLNDAVINETDNVYTTWANELSEDVPRCLTADPAADYVGTITFYGTDINDATISDTLTWSTGHAEMTTSKAFKDLINITIGARTGNGDTTVDVGIDGKLGLNTMLSDTSQILKASLANTDETIANSAVSATVLSQNVVEVTTALDGAKDVKVYMMV